jgi:N-acetylglucosaminyldiphosphoundecaprenol N-acetyl-beta-D-mannosaminyltransferase
MPADLKLSLSELRYQIGTLDQAASRLAERARAGVGTSLVIPVNAQVFVLARQRPELAAAILGAEEVLLDGVSVWFASRLLGNAQAQRHTGVDLMVAICSHLNGSASRVLLLGGLPGSADATRAKLHATCCPDLVIETLCPPIGFERSPQDLAELEQFVRAFQPSIVFVALGAPKQELFMDTYLRAWKVPMAMAVGGSFEMISGRVARAPRWVRAVGMEWFFRILLEPRRLAKRYLYTNTAFLWMLLRELLTKRPEFSGS